MKLREGSGSKEERENRESAIGQRTGKDQTREGSEPSVMIENSWKP